MDACVICGCSSWFFEVSSEGLCGSCERLARMEIEQISKFVSDASSRAESTLNPESKIGHLDAVVSGLENLAEYEKKGVSTPHESPDRLLRENRKIRDDLILETARADLKTLLGAVRASPDAAGKEKLYTEFLIKLVEFKSRLADRAPLDKLSLRVRSALVRIRLNAFLDAGKASERGGDRPGAVRRYQEGLSYLEQKGGRDHNAKKMKSKLAERIRSLGGPGTS